MPQAGPEIASMVAITVGILEVQGAFLEHRVALHNAAKSLNHKIDLRIVEVRTSDDVKQELDGLIIPGGESTTISIYLKRNKMEESLQSWIADKRHVTWGTCAGMILLSKLTENQKLGGQSTVCLILEPLKKYLPRNKGVLCTMHCMCLIMEIHVKYTIIYYM